MQKVELRNELKETIEELKSKEIVDFFNILFNLKKQVLYLQLKNNEQISSSEIKEVSLSK